MKIEPGKSINAPTPRRGAEVTAPGFALANEPAPRVAPTTATTALTPLDALLALQSDEPSRQRRARQTKRGHDALAALEEVARGLLLGRAPVGLLSELDRLRGAAEMTGETGLDDLLREIDTRLAVEAAKLERAVAD